MSSADGSLPPPPPPWHRRLTTVGVTGTNGKSTTTTYVAAALSRLAAPVPRVTTLGFFVGDERLELPGSYATFLRTLKAGLDAGGRFAAIELSSEALGRGFVRSWPCRVGVFTNLTRDHLDAHGSPEHYLASKAQLFVALPPGGAAVLNARDPASALLAEVVPPGVRRIHYGVPSRGDAVADADLEAAAVELSWGGTRVELRGPEALCGRGRELRIRAIGEVFAENALAALAAAMAAGVPADAAAAAISEAPAPPGRFEVVAERPHAVVDYAHTPDALERTLATARRLCRGRLTVVFGAGGERDQAKRPLMGRAARIADRVVLTSDNPRGEDPADIARAVRAGLADHGGVNVVLDRAEAIGAAMRDAGPDDVVVVAGKGHETVQDEGGAARPFSDRDVILGCARR